MAGHHVPACTPRQGTENGYSARSPAGWRCTSRGGSWTCRRRKRAPVAAPV